MSQMLPGWCVCVHFLPCRVNAEYKAKLGMCDQPGRLHYALHHLMLRTSIRQLWCCSHQPAYLSVYQYQADLPPNMTITFWTHFSSAECCITTHSPSANLHMGGMCICRYTAGKRKASSHASPAKRMALTQEVPVTCGSSSGVYDIRRGCISLRAAQHGQVCFACLHLVLLHRA